jgi:hypothetical protein
MALGETSDMVSGSDVGVSPLGATSCERWAWLMRHVVLCMMVFDEVDLIWLHNLIMDVTCLSREGKSGVVKP